MIRTLCRITKCIYISRNIYIRNRLQLTPVR